MAVERGGVAVLREQSLEVAKIVAELVGRHGAVLPSRPMFRLAAHEGGNSERRFARLPDPLLLRRVGDDMAAAAGVGALDASGRRSPVLPSACRRPLRRSGSRALREMHRVPPAERDLLHRIEHLVVEALEAVRLLFEQRRHRVGGREDVVERQQGDARARSGVARASRRASRTMTHVPSVPVTALRDVEVASGEQRCRGLRSPRPGAGSSEIAPRSECRSGPEARRAPGRCRRAGRARRAGARAIRSGVGPSSSWSPS